MTRREFMSGLFALPTAALMAMSVKHMPASKVRSLRNWFVNWRPYHPPPLSLLDVARGTGDHEMLPVIEALSQKNSLLQDVVWQEKNIQLGQKISMVKGSDQTSIWLYGPHDWDRITQPAKPHFKLTTEET